LGIEEDLIAHSTENGEGRGEERERYIMRIVTTSTEEESDWARGGGGGEDTEEWEGQYGFGDGATREVRGATRRGVTYGGRSGRGDRRRRR